MTESKPSIDPTTTPPPEKVHPAPPPPPPPVVEVVRSPTVTGSATGKGFKKLSNTDSEMGGTADPKRDEENGPACCEPNKKLESCSVSFIRFVSEDSAVLVVSGQWLGSENLCCRCFGYSLCATGLALACPITLGFLTFGCLCEGQHERQILRIEVHSNREATICWAHKMAPPFCESEHKIADHVKEIVEVTTEFQKGMKQGLKSVRTVINFASGFTCRIKKTEDATKLAKLTGIEVASMTLHDKSYAAGTYEDDDD